MFFNYFCAKRFYMQTPNNIQIAHSWFNAFNTHQLEELLSLYDEQAEHYSPKLKLRQPETEGWIRGKDALRSWWKDAFERLPDLYYQTSNIMATNERVVMEYIRKVGQEEDMYVAEVLEIRQGKIVASRVYHG